MNLGIEGRVALVTGASKGLGLGTATALAQEGARVAIASRSAERVRAAAEEIGARPYVHDTANVGRAQDLVRSVEEEVGPIDILITNSGGPPASPDPFSFTHDQWRDAYELLMLGAIALVEAVIPGMRQRRWGRILSFSSRVVREPNQSLMLSASHRAGLLAALKTLSNEVAADGITINTLFPGVIATDRAKALGADKPDSLALIPVGRLGTVEEFASTAAYLCSEKAAYITGTTIMVDGGASRAV